MVDERSFSESQIESRIEAFMEVIQTKKVGIRKIASKIIHELH
jgi:hypothetical protein